MAAEIFNDSMVQSGKDGLGKSFWPSGVVALAIDPLYAPAILTVGSIEYQLFTLSKICWPNNSFNSDCLFRWRSKAGRLS